MWNICTFIMPVHPLGKYVFLKKSIKEHVYSKLIVKCAAVV